MTVGFQKNPQNVCQGQPGIGIITSHVKMEEGIEVPS